MLLEGVKVYVGPFIKRSEREPNKEANYTNVYVKNLQLEVDDDKLQEMFAEYGSVTSAVVMKVRESLQRGAMPMNIGQDVDTCLQLWECQLPIQLVFEGRRHPLLAWHTALCMALGM